MPSKTIEARLAAKMGLAKVEFSDEDREVIATVLMDAMIIGSGHLIRKPKGLRRLDPNHIKMDLGMEKRG